MKITKSCFAIITVVVAVSLSSCSVEYRTRHPRPVRHRRVVVVGMEKPAIPVDSNVAAPADQTSVKLVISNDNKTK